VLLGIGQIFLTIGHLIYSYQALGGGTLDDRWCDVSWAAGAVVSVIGGLCVIVRSDPLVAFGAPIVDSAHPRGARTALFVGVAMTGTSMVVALIGAARGRPLTSSVGAVAAVIAVAVLAIRGRSAIRAADETYLKLDRALFENERSRDDLAHLNRELSRANADLGAANVQLRLYQVEIRTLLETVDGRSDGGLRRLVTETTGLGFDEAPDE